MAEQQKAMDALNERVEQIVEQQTNRYTEWFIHNYPELVNDSARFDAMADLSDKLNLEWHDTVEIQNLGSSAVEEAISRASAGKDMQDTMELLRLKYGGKKPQQTTRQEKTSQQLAAASDRPPPTTKSAPSTERCQKHVVEKWPEKVDSGLAIFKVVCYVDITLIGQPL
jgi:hypothetical protein